MSLVALWGLLLLLIGPVASTSGRKEKLLSVFKVIRFRNKPCGTFDSNMGGICYTADECRARRGRATGRCAQGFGVCCLFEVMCGPATVSENVTFFSSDPAAPPVCSLEVCKCNPGICQLRLDFINFSLTGPSTATASSTLILNGEINDQPQNVAATFAGTCDVEQFRVSSPGRAVESPVICGQNSGTHLYVPASDACNELSVTRSPASAMPGEWLIRVIQLGCDDPNLPPEGCDQWFFGPNMGTVSTYNFQGGRHLASQRQNICVRRELGKCTICWHPLNPMTDFQLSGPGKMGITDDLICCAYGANGDDTRGYDCLLVPNAQNAMLAGIKANRFCGASKGLASFGSQTGATKMGTVMNALLDKTICSMSTPFHIRFVSDAFEFVKETMAAPAGFRLQYNLRDCP